MSDTQLSTLVINKLTKEQYANIATPSNEELYFITNEDAYLSANQGSANEGKVLTVGSDGSVTPQDPTGTTDYTQLLNKPQINGNVLTGDKTASQLGFANIATSGSYTDLIDKPSLANVATTGSYEDLSNKPTIPAAQQQVDWNASSGITSIANKPTLANVATSGNYNDLTNKPTIGDLVNTAQLNAINSGITSSSVSQISTNTGDIANIADLIPSAATTSNKLADKAFVNSSISNMAANYVTSDVQGDNFATYAALIAGPYYYQGQSYTLTNNDYALVEADENHSNATTRYVYNGTQWAFQYVVNNSPFSQAQLDAINSTITQNLVNTYSEHVADANIHVTVSDKTTWSGKQDALVSGTNIKTINGNSLLGSGDITVGGGSADIDELTITENSSNKIQTVAQINQNNSVGATTVLYDWVGTLAEYTTNAIATNHPTWICYITDDEVQTATLDPHRVIEFQAPTAANNYTWYRKYADGWVEQGGIWTGTLTANGGYDATSTQNIPITMADTNYCVNITNNGGTSIPTVWEMWCVEQLTTTSFVIHMGAYEKSRTITRMNWEVKGMAAA